MRITQWGEFGLHCSMQLARREREGVTTVGAAEIAEEQEIALDYTQQILQRLRKGGIIESVRGPHGGYRLSRPAASITLGEILKASEGNTFEVICETKPLNEERCAPEMNCNLRHLWLELRDHVNTFLTNRSLLDILDYQAPASSETPVQIGKRVGQP